MDESLLTLCLLTSTVRHNTMLLFDKSDTSSKRLALELNSICRHERVKRVNSSLVNRRWAQRQSTGKFPNICPAILVCSEICVLYFKLLLERLLSKFWGITWQVDQYDDNPKSVNKFLGRYVDAIFGLKRATYETSVENTKGISNYSNEFIIWRLSIQYVIDDLV